MWPWRQFCFQRRNSFCIWNVKIEMLVAIVPSAFDHFPSWNGIKCCQRLRCPFGQCPCGERDGWSKDDWAVLVRLEVANNDGRWWLHFLFSRPSNTNHKVLVHASCFIDRIRCRALFCEYQRNWIVEGSFSILFFAFFLHFLLIVFLKIWKIWNASECIWVHLLQHQDLWPRLESLCFRHGLPERSESGRRDGMAPRWFGPLDRLDSVWPCIMS